MRYFPWGVFIPNLVASHKKRVLPRGSFDALAASLYAGIDHSNVAKRSLQSSPLGRSADMPNVAGWPRSYAER